MSNCFNTRSNTVSAVRYTQCPFGWSKFEPNALALKRFWDLNGGRLAKVA